MDPLPSCSPYLPSYLPPCPPQLLPFHFPNIIYTCTFPTHFFIPSQYPHSYCMLALPPYPPISLFLDISWPSPYYQHPPPPLYIHFYCLPRLSISILAHPIPLPLPAPLPSFSLFWVIFGCFIAFIYFSFCIYMYIYDY